MRYQIFVTLSFSALLMNFTYLTWAFIVTVQTLNKWFRVMLRGQYCFWKKIWMIFRFVYLKTIQCVNWSIYMVLRFEIFSSHTSLNDILEKIITTTSGSVSCGNPMDVVSLSFILEILFRWESRSIRELG